MNIKIDNYWFKIVKIGNYCQFSIGDASLLISLNSRLLISKMTNIHGKHLRQNRHQGECGR